VLNGTPCDINGKDLPLGQAPSPHNLQAENPWTPFTSRGHFELADLLFRRSQMPSEQVDDLMQILAAMSETGVPPFAHGKDLHATIDSISVGNAEWQSFTVQHADANALSGTTQDQDVPPWKLGEYTVWFRDPRELLQNQLSNPDFADAIDYAPRQVFGDKGQRVWSDFMTGNWAWKQCVSNFIYYPEAMN
jgi:hypothetical protein